MHSRCHFQLHGLKLVYLQLQIIAGDQIQHGLDTLQMILMVLRKYNYVAKVHWDEWKIFNKCIHWTLIRQRGIHQTGSHYLEGIRPILAQQGFHLYASKVHQEVAMPREEIQASGDDVVMHIIENLLYLCYWPEIRLPTLV